jgi:hypothetical protein
MITLLWVPFGHAVYAVRFRAYTSSVHRTKLVNNNLTQQYVPGYLSQPLQHSQVRNYKLRYIIGAQPREGLSNE